MRFLSDGTFLACCGFLERAFLKRRRVPVTVK
jgi:hypothetical protein